MRTFTLASCAMYFLAGLVTTSVGSVLPQVLLHYHLSYTVGGQLIFTGSVGFLTGVSVFSYLNGKFSEKALLSWAALMIAISQFGILLLAPFGLFMFLFFLNSVGTAASSTIVATMIMEIYIGRRAVAMSYLEVSFGLGAFFMPLIASLFIALDIWRFQFLITSTLAFSLALVWRRISFSKVETKSLAPLDAAGKDGQKAVSTKKKWIILAFFAVMIFLYGGLEGSLNNFLSAIFISYLGMVSYDASASIGVFWAFMVIGRAATSWIIRKITYSRFLLFSIIGALVSLILFILCKSAATGYLFIGMLGLMMSGIFSITMVYANHSLPDHSRLVTSLITGFSGLGSAIIPALAGLSMDRSGTAVTLWFITIITAAYLVFLLIVNIMQSSGWKPLSKPLAARPRKQHGKPA